jgi:hypothetical protein
MIVITLVGAADGSEPHHRLPTAAAEAGAPFFRDGLIGAGEIRDRTLNAQLWLTRRLKSACSCAVLNELHRQDRTARRRMGRALTYSRIGLPLGRAAVSDAARALLDVHLRIGLQESARNS